MNNNQKALTTSRFAYMDNIRSVIIFSVIAIHAAATYSGISPWYYVEVTPDKLSVIELAGFSFFISFLHAWRMGLLFFISAYLTSKSLAKHGPPAFIKARLVRLGLPLLVYMLVVFPFTKFILLGKYPENTFAENYIRLFKTSEFFDASGPLWFVEVLLFFCLIYGIVRHCTSKSIRIRNITPFGIISIALLTAIATFFVRLVFPIGAVVFNLSLSHFTAYIVMLFLGALIGENNLLAKITDEKNIKFLLLTPLIGVPIWAFIMIAGGSVNGQLSHLGGFCWQSLLFSIWELFTAFGFSLGIIAFFKKKVNHDNKFTKLLRNNSFGVYFLHTPILIAISLALKKLALSPLLKFIAVALIASVLSLLLTYLLKKIKPIGILLK
ncbi:MAG: acyltransferase family protein [Clostridiales bacterium]|jgi:surface polysaccharide O-acyltransferase-like enzyme|nr:acyltransferase family protein [Clostridiales bacterium]MDR2713470.1 acyltransferase family protein [Clostridiales bacterium]